MWKIIDNNGVIHSGTQEEMEIAFELMTTNQDEYLETYPDTNLALYRSKLDDYICDWHGDLILCEQHNIFR